MIPGVTSHARDRAEQRLGRDLELEEWLAVVLDILDGRAALVRRFNGGECYSVAVSGIAFNVWWAPGPGCITTVLSIDMSVRNKSPRTNHRSWRYSQDGNPRSA